MEKRGFDNPAFLIQWKSFHRDAKNYLPSRMVHNKDGKKTLFVLPENKMAGVAFAYIKKDLLYAINIIHLFREVSDIALVKID